jgi:hypothetical protein
LDIRKKRKGQITALPVMVVLLVVTGLIMVVGAQIWETTDTVIGLGGSAGNISASIGEGLETFGDFFPVIVVMVVLGIMISLFIGRGGIMSGVGGGL